MPSLKKKNINKINIDDKINIPRHIAFICDGNGRWAKKRGLPRVEGHKKGVEAIKNVVSRCLDLGVSVTSFYCFSTENFQRPKDEVEYLFNLFRKIEKYVVDFKNKGVMVKIIGDKSLFPEDIQTLFLKIEHETCNEYKMIVNLMIGYGARHELVQAINKIIESGEKTITEDLISGMLYTANIPDPDLIVRASGEQRLSNFMLYQAAYSELYFPQEYWPDFDAEIVDKCVIEYQCRHRRFGKV